jgi:hypothetical protein
MKIWITSFVWEGHLIDNLDSVEDFELLERTEGTMLH